MKKMISLFSVLLTLILCCAWAEEVAEPIVYTSGDWKYVLLEDGTAEITRYTGNTGWVHIPNEIDGYAVTSIGEKAFLLCDSLKRVNIPDGVTNIGNGAFSNCKALWNIEIPDSVTSIGANPFQSCSSLTDIIFTPDHPVLATIDGVLFDKVEKKLIFYPCKCADSSYTIPQGIRSIGEFAFSGCKSLTNIVIPDSVISIGEGAFFHCEGLHSITIPAGVTSIEYSTFNNCSSLTSIIIPNNVTSIGDYAFNWCYSLTSVTIPDSVTSIGDSAFSSCWSLTSITLPDSLTTIGNYSFFNCDELKSVVLPKGVTDISGFSFDIQQTEIIISPDNPVLEILDGVLYNTEEQKLLCHTCSFNSTSYTIPQGILAINDNAFTSCSFLSSITIPDSVASIGTNAFSNCESLKTIIVARNSYAEQYCKENNLRYTFPDANDWLLN